MTDAVALNYRQYSEDGPPMLVLHGLFGSLSNWNWHARKWAEHFSVYVLDLRNHGASPHVERMDYAAMAEDLGRFLDDHGLDDCLLLGHSMGGKAAMRFALDAPQRVRALVVADIAPVTYPAGEHDEIFAGLLAINLDIMRSRQQADGVLEEYVEDEQVRQFLLSNLARDSDGQFHWRINLPVLDRSYDRLRDGIEATSTYEGPVLFLKGDKSDYINESHRDAVLERFPAAEVKVLKRAGHWLHAEKPESFNRLVEEFFRQHEEVSSK